MTQENKKLLILDLCGRYPHHVLGEVIHYDETTNEPINIVGEFKGIDYLNRIDFFYLNEPGTFNKFNIEDFKPYLRSLNTMTDEEKKELSKKYVWNIWSGQIQIRYHSQGCWDDETECPTEEYITLFDWLNTHYFDYRGLISKGLALEAPEDMYKIK